MFPLRRTLLWGAALVPLFLSACQSPVPRRFLIRGREASEEIRIEVVNDNIADMGIFVMGISTNLRLGNVTGKTTATFRVRSDRISPTLGLRLLADPLGSRSAFLSDAVTVNPGATVVLHVHPNLNQSYVVLR